MKASLHETRYQRYAWIALSIASLSAFYASISSWQFLNINLVSIEQARTSIGFTAFSLFLVIASVTGYRNGQPWAWYAFWLLPIAAFAIATVGATQGSTVDTVLYSTVGLVAVIGLLVPYRRFFPAR